MVSTTTMRFVSCARRYAQQVWISPWKKQLKKVHTPYRFGRRHLEEYLEHTRTFCRTSTPRYSSSASGYGTLRGVMRTPAWWTALNLDSTISLVYTSSISSCISQRRHITSTSQLTCGSLSTMKSMIQCLTRLLAYKQSMCPRMLDCWKSPCRRRSIVLGSTSTKPIESMQFM